MATYLGGIRVFSIDHATGRARRDRRFLRFRLRAGLSAIALDPSRTFAYAVDLERR